MVAVMTGVETGVASGVTSPYLLLPSSSWLVVSFVLCWLDLGVDIVIVVAVVLEDKKEDEDEIPAQVSNAAIAIARSSLVFSLPTSSSSCSYCSTPPRCNDDPAQLLSKIETRDCANRSSCSCN